MLRMVSAGCVMMELSSDWRSAAARRLAWHCTSRLSPHVLTLSRSKIVRDFRNSQLCRGVPYFPVGFLVRKHPATGTGLGLAGALALGLAGGFGSARDGARGLAAAFVVAFGAVFGAAVVDVARGMVVAAFVLFS